MLQPVLDTYTPKRVAAGSNPLFRQPAAKRLRLSNAGMSGQTNDDTGHYGDYNAMDSLNIGVNMYNPKQEHLRHNLGFEELLWSFNFAVNRREVRRGPQTGQRYREQLMKTTAALNAFLASPDGRNEFGKYQTATPLLDTWSLAGSQQTQGDVATDALALTLALAKRIVTPNTWIYHTKQSANDTEKRKQFKFLQTRTDTKRSQHTGVVTEDSHLFYIIVREYVGPKRKRSESKAVAYTDFPEEKTVAALQLDRNRRNHKEICNYRWRILPWFGTSAGPNQNEFTRNDVFCPEDSFVGASIPLGIVTNLLGRSLPKTITPDPTMTENATHAISLVVSDTGHTRHKTILTGLPKVELQLRIGTKSQY